jgi:hypothetical protein
MRGHVCTHLDIAQGALVSAVMNLRVVTHVGNFMKTSINITFSKWTHLDGIKFNYTCGVVIYV